MSFVVLPRFTVEEGQLEAFLAAARADAEASVAHEPGCLQFDVVVDRSARLAEVVFYEVYTDRAAFDAHLQTPHLEAFRAALHLCTEGPVGFYERVVP
ncbi:putative quinol monooxygenase [Phaeovulum sp. W22_SRMD_FR3]|uniref:putative quinol monooxygenase n=1 Tax=Phaeovulum sp. W22_SRMD_FR3 TaxID=3240274 RepID=UPI003F96607A